MRAGLALLALAIAATAAADGPTVDVRLEPERIGVEDVARLTVTVVEPGRAVASPDLGDLVNLEVVAGPSQEKRFSWVNGVATSSLGFTYHLRPKGVGSAAVGPVRVEVDGDVLTSEVLSIEVVPGSVTGPSDPRRVPRNPFDPFADLMPPHVQRRTGTVTLRQLVDRRKVWLGQPVVATVVLDCTVAGVEQFEFSSPPAYPGWWAQRVEHEGPISAEVVEVDGEHVNRYVVARHVLVPLKAGELEVPEVVARVAVRGTGFFAPPQVVERTAEGLTVDVRPQPAPPPGFSGAVGKLEYQARLEPSSVRFGESTVLTIRLEGSGNLPLVEAPAQWPSCAACEGYPPESDDEVTVDATGIHGARVWRQTLLPRQPGTLELAPATVAVFDPASGGYATQVLGPLTLEVEPPPATPTPTVVADALQQAPAGTAEAGGRPPGTVAGAGGPAWPWMVAMLVAGAAVGGLGAWWASRRRGSGVPPRRRGQSPADRARQLQLVLERWWLDLDQEQRTDDRRIQLEGLRRELETVRFAPGRADHSQTVADLEERCRRLLRRA